MTAEVESAPETTPETESEKKDLKPIWGEVNGKPFKIPILGLTGPFNSGKTLWGLQIDPANTLMFDFEKSAASYEGIGVTPIDVPAEMLEVFPDPDAVTGLQYFNWLLKRIRAIPKGKYSVIMFDTIADAERGLVDYTANRYEHYGAFQSAEAFKKTKGIFWSAVKGNWQRIISEISSRCQTFVFTAHLHKEWQDGRPTSKLVPEGKDTLMKLASLYLRLSRTDVNRAGQEFETKKPWATRLKCRLTVFSPELEVIPVLPSKVTDCDPNRIRHFIQNPADLKKASQNRIVTMEKQLSDDEKLRLEARIAEDRLRTAETQQATAAENKELRNVAMDRMEQEKRAEAELEAKLAKQGNETPEVPKDTSEPADSPEVKKAEASEEVKKVANDDSATSTGSAEKAKPNVQVGSPATEKSGKADVSPDVKPENKPSSPNPPEAVADPPPAVESEEMPAGEDGRYTLEQVLKLKDQVIRKKETWTKALSGYGCATPDELTSEQIDHLGDRLSRQRKKLIDRGELENWSEQAINQEPEQPLTYSMDQLKAAKSSHVASNEEWRAYLDEYGCTSGKQLTPRQANDLCGRILEKAKESAAANSPEATEQVPLDRDDKSNWGNAAAAGK